MSGLPPPAPPLPLVCCSVVGDGTTAAGVALLAPAAPSTGDAHGVAKAGAKPPVAPSALLLTRLREEGPMQGAYCMPGEDAGGSKETPPLPTSCMAARERFAPDSDGATPAAPVGLLPLLFVLFPPPRPIPPACPRLSKRLGVS